MAAGRRLNEARRASETKAWYSGDANERDEPGSRSPDAAQLFADLGGAVQACEIALNATP